MKRNFTTSRAAFTLVEMLVVIGIIGILAAVLMGTFSGGTESARSARCLSNMRNLASACQSAGVALGYYPPAGSFETVEVGSTKSGKYETLYHELHGWIAWNSQYAYRGEVTSHKGSASWNTSMYDATEDARKYCMTNGVLWKYVNGNHSVYICPKHQEKKKALNPNWSYVMNAYFKWDSTKGKRAFPEGSSLGLIQYGKLSKADRRLLFAEIPFAGIGTTAPEDTSGELCDSILQYKGCTGCGSPESIGFNHKSGKRYCAHVAFADGHTEKLIYPNEYSEAQMQELTEWLCEAKDISFDGKEYKELTN